MKIPSDKWFNQPLATAAREYLELRKSAGLGPASAEEIFEALLAGDFRTIAERAIDYFSMRGAPLVCSFKKSLGIRAGRN